VIVLAQQNNIKQIGFLIKRGGGTGPMKPGNRFMKHGANSYRAKFALKDKKSVRNSSPLLIEEGFLIFYV